MLFCILVLLISFLKLLTSFRPSDSEWRNLFIISCFVDRFLRASDFVGLSRNDRKVATSLPLLRDERRCSANNGHPLFARGEMSERIPPSCYVCPFTRNLKKGARAVTENGVILAPFEKVSPKG